MTTPYVLLDVDGILADFVGGYLRSLLECHNLHYTRKHVTERDIGRALQLDSAVVRAMDRHITRAQWCMDLSVYPGAKEGVAALREIADVHIVTAPWDSSRHWAGERQEWLRGHFGFTVQEITQTHAKHRVHGDVLLDDTGEHVTRWMQRHPDGLGLLWATPHNGADVGGELHISWGTVIARIREHVSGADKA